MNGTKALEGSHRLQEEWDKGPRGVAKGFSTTGNTYPRGVTRAPRGRGDVLEGPKALLEECDKGPRRVATAPRGI